MQKERRPNCDLFIFHTGLKESYSNECIAICIVVASQSSTDLYRSGIFTLFSPFEDVCINAIFSSFGGEVGNLTHEVFQVS